MKHDWICPCCGYRMGTYEFTPINPTVAPTAVAITPWPQNHLYGTCMNCGDALPPPTAAGHICRAAKTFIPPGV